MEIGKYKTREVQPTVLRLHPELRDELIRLAALNGRSLTREIAARLLQSIEAAAPPIKSIAPVVYTQIAPMAPLTAEQPRASYGNAGLSEVDKAMLAVFQAMPVDKQLALLSLFK